MNGSRKVLITDTTLRDAHQSLMATRMRIEDILEIAGEMDKVGFYSMEVWGGATFDTCMRFLDEDPWERLKKLRSKVKNTPLQMLLRGQNLLGYRHYADDVVEAFIKHAVNNGINIIRVFDALNDLRNMEKTIEYGKKVGVHIQGTICYTISPLHDNEHFVQMARQLEKIGCDSLCIKDMAGLLSPYNAYNLIKTIKETVRIPLQLHCHCTSGMAPMAYLKAIEAGIDVVDTATSSLAMGASQPPTETIVASLEGTPHATGLDLEKLSQISGYFKNVRSKYQIPMEAAVGVDTNVLSYQIPGGMISNLASQLAQQQASHLLKEALAEVPRVRADLGYPPLVTPSSQLVGTQAVVNVLLGERYKMVSTEIKNYVRGYYGRPPGEIAPELKEKILHGVEQITVRPADLLEPQLEKARAEIAEFMEKEEDLLSYILFPQVALLFFKRRRGLIPHLEEEPSPPEKKKAQTNLNLSALYRVEPRPLGSEEEDDDDFVYPT